MLSMLFYILNTLLLFQITATQRGPDLKLDSNFYPNKNYERDQQNVEVGFRARPIEANLWYTFDVERALNDLAD